ncbi:MAG: hypothetical protein JNL96_09030 [Planctomycetaceae bacterium]|nr:hypothetical protein [Planctomycetaceae bacterium]
MMNRGLTSRLVRSGRFLYAAAFFAGMLFCGDAALAQSAKDKDAKAAEETRGLTLPYFSVGVAAVLIIAPVCWPALRRWDLPFHEE